MLPQQHHTIWLHSCVDMPLHQVAALEQQGDKNEAEILRLRSHNDFLRACLICRDCLYTLCA